LGGKWGSNGRSQKRRLADEISSCGFHSGRLRTVYQAHYSPGMFTSV
jgi:hypothetical protein